MVEWAAKNGCFHLFHPQEEPQLPPAPWGGSPSSAGGSEPGSFKLLPLGQDSEHVRFCARPLRMERCSLLPLGSAVWKPRGPSEPGFRGDVAACCRPAAWVPSGGLGFLDPVPLQLYYSSRLRAAGLGWGVLTVLRPHPRLPSHCGSFFVSFSVECLFSWASGCPCRQLLCS